MGSLFLSEIKACDVLQKETRLLPSRPGVGPAEHTEAMGPRPKLISPRSNMLVVG